MADNDSKRIRKVVCVEDEPDIRELYAIVLKRQGLAVYPAKDGLEGLEVIARERPDLALLNISMPRMDGITALKHLKADPDQRHVPVIMITARGDMDLDCLLLGAEEYIYMGDFDINTFVRTVDKFLALEGRSAVKPLPYSQWLLDAYTNLVRLYYGHTVIGSARLFLASEQVGGARLTLQGEEVAVRDAFQEFGELKQRALKQISMIPPYLVFKFLKLNPASSYARRKAESCKNDWEELGERQTYRPEALVASIMPLIRDCAIRIQAPLVAIHSDRAVSNLWVHVTDDKYRRVIDGLRYSSTDWSLGDEYQRELNNPEKTGRNTHPAWLLPSGIIREGRVRDYTQRALGEISEHLGLIDDLLGYSGRTQD